MKIELNLNGTELLALRRALAFQIRRNLLVMEDAKATSKDIATAEENSFIYLTVQSKLRRATDKPKKGLKL